MTHTVCLLRHLGTTQSAAVCSHQRFCLDSLIMVPELIFLFFLFSFKTVLALPALQRRTSHITAFYVQFLSPFVHFMSVYFFHLLVKKKRKTKCFRKFLSACCVLCKNACAASDPLLCFLSLSPHPPIYSFISSPREPRPERRQR